MFNARRAALDAGTLVTIDSGDPLGWALWRGNVLFSAGSCALENFPLIASVDLVVFELPNFHARGSVEDVAKCAARGGLVAGFLRSPFAWVLPVQWKGQVPKGIMVDRVKSKLDPSEANQVAGRSSHVYDSIGIGLWLRRRL